MPDAKGIGGQARRDQGAVTGVRGAHGLDELVVVALWQLALLVQQRDDPELALEQRERLLVAAEAAAAPWHALRLVLAPLSLKGHVVELALQLLVGVVDAELLEAVGRERLEAEDVEHTHGAAATIASSSALGRTARGAQRAGRGEGIVDAVDEAGEDAAEERLGQRVARLPRLLRRERRHHQLATQRPPVRQQRLAEVLGGHVHGGRDGVERLLSGTGNDACSRLVGARLLELHVAQQQHRRQAARERRQLVRPFQPHGGKGRLERVALRGVVDTGREQAGRRRSLGSDPAREVGAARGGW